MELVILVKRQSLLQKFKVTNPDNEIQVKHWLNASSRLPILFFPFLFFLNKEIMYQATAFTENEVLKNYEVQVLEF